MLPVWQGLMTCMVYFIHWVDDSTGWLPWHLQLWYPRWSIDSLVWNLDLQCNPMQSSSSLSLLKPICLCLKELIWFHCKYMISFPLILCIVVSQSVCVYWLRACYMICRNCLSRIIREFASLMETTPCISILIGYQEAPGIQVCIRNNYNS